MPQLPEPALPPEPRPGHEPVLAERVLALFEPVLLGRPAVLLDATVGLGGHTALLLARYPQLRVLGIDRDAAALAHARARLSVYPGRVQLVHRRYDALPGVLAEAGLRRVDAVLFDLGVSSLQLDQPERGFSYARDGELDMRMDRSEGMTAAQLLADYSVAELTRVLREYGEERYAQRIAQRIAQERVRQPLRSSARLAELVREAIPARARRTGGNPAKRTFQALRIEVNGELDSLRVALPAALAALAVGGRILVLAYQSLEDRIVKRALVAGATSSAPLDLPVIPAGEQPQLRLLTRGAERASATELAMNRRAASARLRAAERIREAA